MVAKRKLTIETLSKLGRRKLAELLIAEAAGNRQLTRTLNLAISAEEGPAALGASLGTRLATLAKSRSMLSYDEGRELIAELDGLRTTIVETLGPQESRLAFELLLKLIDLHPSILERVDDSSGRVGTVFSNSMRRPRATGATSQHRTGCAGCDGVPEGHQQRLRNI